MRIGDFFTLYKTLYQREAERSNHLQSRVLDLENANRELWSRVDAAQQREREAIQRVADFATKRCGMGTIFGEYDSVPSVPKEEGEAVRSGPMTAREIVDAARTAEIARLEEELLGAKPAF